MQCMMLGPYMMRYGYDLGPEFCGPLNILHLMRNKGVRIIAKEELYLCLVSLDLPFSAYPVVSPEHFLEVGR